MSADFRRVQNYIAYSSQCIMQICADNRRSPHLVHASLLFSRYVGRNRRKCFRRPSKVACLVRRKYAILINVPSMKFKLSTNHSKCEDTVKPVRHRTGHKAILHPNDCLLSCTPCLPCAAIPAKHTGPAAICATCVFLFIQQCYNFGDPVIPHVLDDNDPSRRHRIWSA